MIRLSNIFHLRSFSKRLTVLMVILLMSTSLFASSARDVLLSQGYVEVPIYFSSHPSAILVDIAFSDGNSHPFLVDSGSTVTSFHLGSDGIAAMGMRLHNKSILNGGSGGAYIRERQATIPMIRMGQFTAYNEPAYVSMSGGTSHLFTGIIGADFLRRHQAILDVANHTLYLKPSGAYSASRLLASSLMQAGYQAIPLQRSASRHQIVMVSVNGSQATPFLFDSGASKTLVSDAYARSHGMAVEQNVDGATGATGGHFSVGRTYVNRFVVGHVAFGNQQVYTTNFSHISAGSRQVSGAIGIDWMSDHEAIVDMAHDVVFVRR